MLGSDLRTLLGQTDLDFAFLLQPRIFLIARDLQLLLFGLEIFALDLNLGFLLDIVTRFAARFDFFGQLGQTLRIKRIVWIEEFFRGLVEARQ